MKEAKVAVLGAGSRWTALAEILAENGASPWLRSLSESDAFLISEQQQNPRYAPGYQLHQEITSRIELEEVMRDAELIVIAVPSQALASCIHSLKPYYHGQILVLASKGWQSSNFSPFSNLIKVVLGEVPLVILSGGSHAEEVMKKNPTGVVLASEKKTDADQVSAFFQNQRFRCHRSPDIIGVQLMGAFKNVIALGCGIAEGLGYGANTKALLLTQGVQELLSIGEVLGTSSETFISFAGLGDLYVTASSPLSRNRNAGRLLAQGHSKEEITWGLMHMVAEGLNMIPAIDRFLEKQKADFPFLEMILAIVNRKRLAQEAFTRFLEKIEH